MIERKRFLIKLSEAKPTRLEQAIALLWYYNLKQEYEERLVTDLRQDLVDDSFGSPDITKLRRGLKSSKFTVNGSRPDSFRINAARFSELNKKYGPLINFVEVEVTPSVIPIEFIKGKHTYFERMVYQINGSYDYGFYDACAAMTRRLMESLIIEVYLQEERSSEIKTNNVFFQLGGLIKKIKNDNTINISRNLPKNMDSIKDLGDTAVHDRTYITQREDIDDKKDKIRKVIRELLVLAKLI